MEDVIKKIVSESVNAPSGDNCQPWYFSVDQSVLLIYKKDEGNNNYLDFKSRGTLLAHGALVENISISASKYGHTTEISFFPDSTNKNLISKIVFLENVRVKDEDGLFPALSLRVTNRKTYSKKQIALEDKNTLLKGLEGTNTRVDFIETEKEKKLLFSSATQMERVALQNEFIHSLFFGSIVWSKKQESNKKQGLYLKTMELPPPIEFFFKILRHWSVAKLLISIGFSKKVAQGNAQSYQTSSAIIFSIKDTDSISFIETGRLVERVWLRATNLGMAVQPLAGLIYVYQRLSEERNIDKVLSDAEVSIVEENYKNIQSLTSLNGGIIAMILRVGYAEDPSAKSSKKTPEFI